MTDTPDTTPAEQTTPAPTELGVLLRTAETVALDVQIMTVPEDLGSDVATSITSTLPRHAAAALLRALADTLDDTGPLPDRG